MPSVVIAGLGLVVSHHHAERLHAAIPGSRLQVVPGVGHMVHHVATSQVVQAIADVSGRPIQGTSTVQPAQLAVPPVRAITED